MRHSNSSNAYLVNPASIGLEDWGIPEAAGIPQPSGDRVKEVCVFINFLIKRFASVPQDLHYNRLPLGVQLLRSPRPPKIRFGRTAENISGSFPKNGSFRFVNWIQELVDSPFGNENGFPGVSSVVPSGA
jgi:hypothetical protein